MSKRNNKLLLAMLCAGLLVPAVTTFSGSAHAAEQKEKSVSDKIADRHKDRKTHIVSQTVGKRAQKAYELYSKDDIDGAIAELKDVEPSKTFDKAYVNRFLGNLYASQEGKTKTAISYLAKAVEPDVLNTKEQADTMRLLGDMYLSDEQFQKALDTYKKWEAFAGVDDANIKVRMAQANYELKNYEAMIPLVNKAIEISDKPNKNAYILKLSSYYERKDYKNSIKVLEDLVRNFPQESRWWAQLGMFYMMDDQYDKALETLDAAYRNNMLEKEQQYLALIQLYSNQGIPWRAATVLEKHVKDGSIKRDKRTIRMLANSFMAAKEMPQAAKYFGELADLTGEAKYYRQQGNVMLQAQNYKGAVKALDKALKAGVKHPGSVHMMMAEAYLDQDDLRSAYRHVKAATKDPKSSKAAKSWISYLQEKAKRQGVDI